MTTTPDLTIRRATHADQRALERLAALDSRALTDDRYLLAEAGGTLVAALALTAGEAIADPFRRTADTVAMLRMHAAATTADEARGGLLRRAVRLRLRAAAQA